MALAELSSFGSLISALAVAGSLIYLGLQTHQAAKHTRALIAQSRVTRNTDMALKMADADLSAAILSRYGVTPTAEMIRQFQTNFLINAQFAGADETFEQYENGLLSGFQFASFRGSLVGVFGLPGFREAWRGWRTAHPDSNPKFLQFMDEIAAKAPPLTLETLTARESGGSAGEKIE